MENSKTPEEYRNGGSDQEEITQSKVSAHQTPLKNSDIPNTSVAALSNQPETSQDIIYVYSYPQETVVPGKPFHYASSKGIITDTLRVIPVNGSETPQAENNGRVNLYHLTIETKSKDSDDPASQNSNIPITSAVVSNNRSESFETKVNVYSYEPETIKTKKSRHNASQDRSTPSTSAMAFSSGASNDDHQINIFSCSLVTPHPLSDLTKKNNPSEPGEEETVTPRNSVKISRNVEDFSKRGLPPQMSSNDERIPLLPDARRMHVPLIPRGEAIAKFTTRIYICFFAFMLLCFITSILVYVLRRN